MSTSSTLTALAEAVADGSDADWTAAESQTTDPAERELAGYLLAAAAIGRRKAALYTLSIGPNHFLAQPIALAPGDTWGPLRIVEHIGRGRFGDVYRAHDATLDREVALKILRTSATADDSAPSAVVHEGRLMARVRHPNVITIHGAQTIDGRTGLWMEFIEGRTLAAEVRENGPLGPDEVARVGIALCDALAAVHAAGLVHRDIKALNVLREKTGRIVLGDFGTGQEATQGPGEAVLVGTPAYVAPEVFAGQPATARSDLYSLGALLYYLATGAYPVDGRSIAALREAHAKGTRRLLRAEKPDWTAALTTAIDRALTPDPEGRFDSAREMQRALTNARPRRTKQVALVGAAIACSIVLGLTYYDASRMPDGKVAPAREILVGAVSDQLGDANIEDTVRSTLERTLTATGLVRIMSQTRIEHRLRMMRSDQRLANEPSLAREVALRAGGINAVVNTRVVRSGTGLLLFADVVRPSDGASIASVKSHARRDEDLPGAVETLAESVAAAATGRPELSTATPGHPEVTTSSFRALELFKEAKDMNSNDEISEVPPSTAERVELLMRRALEEDPQFAMGHTMLADSLQRQGRAEESRKHIELARAHVTRNFEPEYLYVTGMSDHLEGILAPPDDPAGRAADNRAVSAFEARLRLQPNDWIPHLSLLRAYREVYRHAEANHLEIRLADLFQRPAAQAVGAAAAIARGDIAAARKLLDRISGIELTQRTFGAMVPWIKLFEGHVAWLEYDPARTARITDEFAPQLRSMPPGTLRHLHAEAIYALYLSIGRIRDAEATAVFMTTADRPPLLGRAFLQRVDTSATAPLLESVREAATLPPSVRRLLASLWLELGNATRAKALLADVPRRHRYEGQLALAEGRLDEAITLLTVRQNAPELPWIPLWVGEIPRSLATALVRANRVAEAILVLEEASVGRSVSVSGGVAAYEWIRVRDDLAVLYRQVGRTADAERVEAELRTLLVLADADHVVKRRLDALAQTPTR